MNVSKSVALRLRVTDRSLGRVELDGRVLRNNERFVSPDFERAKNQMDLEITTGFGHIALSTGY